MIDYKIMTHMIETKFQKENTMEKRSMTMVARVGEKQVQSLKRSKSWACVAHEIAQHKCIGI